MDKLYFTMHSINTNIKKSRVMWKRIKKNNLFIRRWIVLYHFNKKYIIKSFFTELINLEELKNL